MSDYLRFIFSQEELNKIDPKSLVVEDMSYSDNPPDGYTYPQSLIISFNLKQGITEPPSVTPIFQGEMRFIANPNAPGQTPDPINVKESEYKNWNTKGTLMIKFTDEIGSLGSKLSPYFYEDFRITPTVMWLDNITITKKFLFTTLQHKLKREKDDPKWLSYDISNFLKGESILKLRLNNGIKIDDITSDLPTVDKDVNGDYKLVITFASKSTPHDGKENFDPKKKLINKPSNPKYSAIPARYIYQTISDKLVDTDLTHQVVKKIVAKWPKGSRYFRINCTRTFNDVLSHSVHFYNQTIVINVINNKKTVKQRLATNGVVFLHQSNSSGKDEPKPKVNITFEGDMKWIMGNDPEVWRKKAEKKPVEIDFATFVEKNAHIQLRQTMDKEMLIEKEITPGDLLCTYLTMRRSLRALINNRIAGGRLNYKVDSTGNKTRKIINEAWENLRISAELVSENKPVGHINHADLLFPVWVAFFPEKAKVYNAIAGWKGKPSYTVGHVAYYLWQSRVDLFNGKNTKYYFPDNIIGRGAPGALVYTGLSSSFTVESIRSEKETKEQYINRMTEEVLSNQKPGSMLQFWTTVRPFNAILRRTQLPKDYSGHSPTFKKYKSGGKGFKVIDQFGEQPCNVITENGINKLAVWNTVREVWIGANWDE